MKSVRLPLLCLLLSACSTVPSTAPIEAVGAAPGSTQPIPQTEAQAIARCSNYESVMGSAHYPAQAVAQGLSSGSATIAFNITATGELANIRAVRASHPVFA